MRGVCSAFGVVCVLVASPTRADEGAELRWSAPGGAGCPTEAEVRAAVTRFAGDGADGLRVPVTIEVTRAGDGGWSARVTLREAGDPSPRERRIAGATCAEVADAAAVVAALARSRDDAPPPPPARRAPPPAALPAAEPAVGADEITPEREETPLRPGVRVLGGGDFLALPNTAFAVEAAALLLVGDNRFEVRGLFLAPSTATSTVDTSATARMLLAGGGLRYCRMFVPRAIELGACASLEAGALHGASAGVMHPASGSSPWVAPGIGLLGAWPFLPRLALAASLEGVVPLVRDSFQVEGVGQLYKPPSATVRALVGLEARFR